MAFIKNKIYESLSLLRSSGYG